jgi:hypothetical protein
MKNNILGSLFFALCAGLLLFGLPYYSFKLYEYFNPKYTEVDSKTFKESVQYNEGMVRDLESMQIQYINATETEKESIKPIIMHRFEVYDTEKLPPNLKKFYDQLSNNEL